MKFMRMYGMNDAEAAALVIGRRYCRFSERIPTNYASLAPADAKKHVWSNWNKLKKALEPLKSRDVFFRYRDANSIAEVILSIGRTSSPKKKKRKIYRKRANALQHKGESPLLEFPNQNCSV